MWHEINTVVLSLLVMKGFGRRPRRPSLGQLPLHVLAKFGATQTDYHLAVAL